jgi:hypothetical protein
MRITYSSTPGSTTREELSREFVAGHYSTDPASTPDIPVITLSAQDFQRLPLTGSGIHLDPDRDYYYVKLPIWFY